MQYIQIYTKRFRNELFLSGGRHLENEMYISTGEMYISIWRPPDRNNTSHQLKYTSFHLKYTSHSLSGGRQILSGGRQIYLAAATYRMRCIF